MDQDLAGREGLAHRSLVADLLPIPSVDPNDIVGRKPRKESAPEYAARR